LILVAVIAITVIMCVAPSIVLAEEPEASSARENSLHAGSWSLQFQIEEDIGLKPFSGMIISVKRHISRRSALRIGLDLDIVFDDQIEEMSYEYADTLTYIYETSYDNNSQSVALDFLYVRYLNPDATINLFWGAGPRVRFNRSRRETEKIRTDFDQTDRTTTDYFWRAWGAGILGVAGVEWFATKGIGFHAEYRASFMYTNSDIENVQYSERINRTSKNTVEGEDWNFQGVSVIMGISVYF
jgi:hypothetical protein